MLIELETAVAAPPERVFDLYLDAARVPEWRPAIAEIAERSGPMDRAGVTFTTRYHGRTPDSQGEVVESERPRRHVLAGRGAVPYDALLTLERVSGGTVLRFSLSVRLPGGPLGRLAERAFLRRKFEQDTQRDFARLKQLAEAGPAP